MRPSVRRAGRSAPRSSAARMSFVEVLPVEPVIATTFAPASPSARRHARASDCRPARGSGWTSTAPAPGRQVCRRGVAGTAAGPASRDSAWAGATSTPHAPARNACARRPPVHPLARQAHEQVSGAHLAGVDHTRARRWVGPTPRADHLRPRGRGHLRRVPLDHAPAPAASERRACSASRATFTSSNGTFTPSANSWPCSWPLPAMTTTSPLLAAGSRDRSPSDGR